MRGKARIKKGVRPFGGRVVDVLGFDEYPNGRRVVRIKPPTDSRHLSPREYNLDEVEILTVEQEVPDWAEPKD